jgi:hypothetical protein
MERKIGIALIILGLAAFSPAPVNKAKGSRTFQAEKTQEQVGKEMTFNGVMPVVGQVPRVINQGGMAQAPKNLEGTDSVGQGSVRVGTKSADKIGASIALAGKRIDTEEHPTKFAWFYGVLIALVGFLGWKLFQYKIEKSTPVPEFSKRFLKEMKNGRM